ncbi:MAG: hypothetical protein ACYTBJ_10530 [Planctomycetota bacterium]|jgi:hypothetical protein
MNDQSSNPGIVLGQKYAYATAALLLGITTYIQLLGIERAILTIVFACLALRTDPEPRLDERRLWAKAGFILGLLQLIIVPTIVILKFEFFRELIAALEKLQ